MQKTIALVDIRLFLYLHYHRHESLLNVLETICGVSPLPRFTKIYFVYDNGKSPYHKTLYDGYKENRTVLRAKQTETEKARYKDFSEKYNNFTEITKFFGTNIKIQGEADTYIEVLANKFSKDGHKVYIFSSDGDFNCMLSDRSLTQVTARGDELDYDGVSAKKGVTPEQLLLSKCLAGDAKDGIQGIKKLGEIKDKKTGAVLKKLFSNCTDTDSLITALQYRVDNKTRGMALPEDYPTKEATVTTVKELYEFNLNLNKAFTYNDLTDNHKEQLRQQVNVPKTTWDKEEFDLVCWEYFGAGIIVPPHTLKFYNIKEEV